VGGGRAQYWGERFVRGRREGPGRCRLSGERARFPAALSAGRGKGSLGDWKPVRVRAEHRRARGQGAEQPPRVW